MLLFLIVCGTLRGNRLDAPGKRVSPPRRKNTMARVKRGSKRRAPPQKDVEADKGFFLTKSKALPSSAQEAVNRAERFSFRDRRRPQAASSDRSGFSVSERPARNAAACRQPADARTQARVSKSTAKCWPISP